ncbi:MAG: hypothetical protein AAF797_04640 [Planctomycetota bacterium]
MVAKSLTLELDDAEYQRLAELARASGRPMNQMAQELLRRELDSHTEPEQTPSDAASEPDEQSSPSALDRLMAAGVVGALKGLPPDLSTNPKYMEGFGE